MKGQPYTVDSTYTSQSKIEEKDQYGNVTGIWTFSGWKLDGKVVTGEQIMGDETVYLRGVWTLTEQDVPKHTVSYDWGENAPASETLPAGITGLVKGESYTIDSTYTSATVVEVTDDSGVVIGTYTFSGWTDPNDGVMGETDVTVTGTWTYTETGKVNVTYEVTGNEKPDDSTVSNMPENTQVYKGSTVTAGSVPTTTSNSNGEKLGTWKFSGWTTTDETTNVQEDVKFTGSWTFTAYDTITVTPADITIYMGGDKGYEAVVNGSGEYITTNTLPTPLFKVKLPEGVNIEDITVSGTTSGGESRGWTFELAGKTDKGEDLYYIVPDEGQDPIRVTYTDDNGKAIVSDLFEPTAELYETYKINIYYNDVTSIFATDGTNTYVIDADDDNYGTLTVRAVDEHEENPVIGIDEPVSEPVEE